MAGHIFNFKNYPIIFIGSGISKRYIEGYPTWEELLNEYWSQCNETNDFYHYLLTIKDKYKHEALDESALNHKIYTEAASYIEERFNQLFISNQITLDGLDAKKVFSENISPFKYSICKRFNEINIKKDVNIEEFESFKKLLKKAKMIITTNYDAFIELLLHEQNITPKLYIGNEGFFEDTVGWCELYKIHGDIKDPKSIIINSDDYEKYDEKAILISAKILSNMIKNPIIFIGYSLTDRNVKKLLSDFSSQLPKEDGRKTAERIILIQRKADENEVLVKQVTDQQLQVTYTSIETDNYKIIYDEVSLVDEGLSPYDVLRYQRAIKNLIINEGEKGKLDNLLVSPSDLDSLEESVKAGKNLVVALGDKKYVFTQLKEKNYLEDYLFEKNEISNKLALEFIIDFMYTTRIPFSKLVSSTDFKEINLPPLAIRKLNQRIERHGNLESLLESIIVDRVNSLKNFASIQQIINGQYSKLKELAIITKNIKRLDPNDIERYIRDEAFPQFKNCENSNLKTEFRKLFLAYDLLKNGDIKKVVM